MKKLIAVVVALVILVSAFGIAHVAKVNKTRYYVEAYCELQGDELVFTFHGAEFTWELENGDKIPKGNVVVLVMDNNGTKGMLEDDSIISYKEI
jgi:hypothetical protein